MDSSEWELSKENVQPIKQGRKIPNLTAALTPCGFAGSNVGDDTLYWKHQKDKQNFEAEIRTYEGDDFLDIWYRYILWTEENVPKGGREIGTLLERCIKEFQDVSKYENDERYFNVWLKYADCCADPLEIFNYLHAKGTCSRLALLYIAWASACENVEDFKKADQVLLLGIEKNAQPVEMLQKHHTGFQHRLAAHIVASEEKSPAYGQANPRKALGSLMSTGKKNIVGVFRNSSSQNPSQSRSVVAKQEKKGLGFFVHHDSDESENRLPEGRGSDWKEAPTQGIMSKENLNMPGKWTGEKAHSRRPPGKNISLVRPALKQSFQVHIDENAEQIGHVSQAVGNQVLSVRKSDLEVSNNPLKVISNSGENSGPSNMRAMYDKSKVYAGAEEFQFEEIRAAKHRAMLKQGLPLPKNENSSKRERERGVQPKAKKKERVMYPNNKVYAFEGEFQPEELMARLYHERGNRLRVAKVKSSQPPVSSKVPLADLPFTGTASRKSSVISALDNDENIHPSHSDARDIAVSKNSRSILPSGSIRNIHIPDDVENILPPHCNPGSLADRDHTRNIPSQGSVPNIHLQNDAENIPPLHCNPGVMTNPHHTRGIHPPGSVPNIHFQNDAENIAPPPHANPRSMANTHHTKGIHPSGGVPNIHFQNYAENIPPPGSVPNIHLQNDAENIAPPPHCGVLNIHLQNDAENIAPPPHCGVLNIHFQNDAENISPSHCNPGSMADRDHTRDIPPQGSVPNIHLQNDAENIAPPPHCNPRSMANTYHTRGIPPHGGVLNIHLQNDAENISPPHCNPGSMADRDHTRDTPAQGSVPNIHLQNDAETIPPPHRNPGGVPNLNHAGGIPPSGTVQHIGNGNRLDLGNKVGTPNAGPQLRKSFLGERSNKSERKNNLQKGVITPRLGRYKPDLTGPSPTLTTKEAFADVMPWFNTTVGLSTSDDELENHFKNDDNDDEEDGMGWDGIPFGEGFAQNGLKRKLDSETTEVDNDWNEDQENLPPFGYSQTRVERPQLGVLQPSVGIPFEPLKEFETDKDEAAEDDEQLKKVCSDENTAPLLSTKQEVKHGDDETTRWMNHSQFAAAARLMSTPFTESLSPPKLENLHCSRIQAHDEGQDVSTSIQARDERKDVSQQDQASNISSSSYNANSSKGLSPILECSDEYARTGSSKSSSHSSDLSSKSNAPTAQSVTMNQAESTFVQDTTSNSSEIQNRSMDITVHDMNGSVLKKINPFDPNLCSQLLAQLDKPVSTFSGYHDFTEEDLPKFASNKSVMIGEEVFEVNGIAGSGAYAKVYSATKIEPTPANKAAVALKVQRPASVWEFYISSELQRRMEEHGKSESEIASVVRMTDYYVFADGSCGLADYHKKGTFLDFVNDCWKPENGRQERTALYYAVEMMKILECIHDCGIIHGDIKPDNFVLFESIGDSGEGLYGLGLIDFGCAIDAKLFPPGTRFSVDKSTESFECIEMKTQKPWTTQVDTYGMLCSLHCLVFGNYMKVHQDKKTGRWKITKSFSRTWNRPLWNKLFDVFLNIPSCDDLPSLAAVRGEFQEYLGNEIDDE